MHFSPRVVNILSTIAIIILIGGLLILPKSKELQTIDLISTYDWTHFAGASSVNEGIDVSPLNRTIVGLDGNDRPNSSVNLAGPSIVFTGDFSIDAKTSSFVNGAAIRLYGGVPIIYDEWRYEQPSIEIKNEGSFIKVSLWDGTDSSPSKVQEYKSPNNLKTLQINKSDDDISFSGDGETIFNINAKGVLAPGKLWLGVSATEDLGFKISSLELQAESGTVQVRKGLSSPAKNPISSGHINFGAAVALNPLLTDENYRSLALNQFNLWTPENELKAQFIHPAANTYSFNEADLMVDTALKNNIAIHGHALVFGEANPQWMRTAPDTQKQQIMTDHIEKVTTHYKDKIKEWDVVNEPLSDEESDYLAGGNGLRKNIWYQAMGKEYIATALQAARVTDNDSKLYINDYGLESDGPRWDAMLRLIDDLQAHNVSLNGIGFESHIHETSDEVDPKVLALHMQELAKRGLSVRISEIDVYGDNGTSKQALQYSSVLSTCISQPNCAAYSTWGVSDKYASTTEYDSYPLEYGNDLLWDSSFNSKPAYKSIRKIMNNAQ